MKELRSWVVFCAFFAQYLLYRLRLAPRPVVGNKYSVAITVLSRMLGWRVRLRVCNAEMCPDYGAVIFCGNHTKLDDPIIMYGAVCQARGACLPMGAMMRDDFFKLPALLERYVHIKGFFEIIGTHTINREGPTLAQMRPFLHMLRDGEGFMMFPAGTRTRSGAFVEYGENTREPGGISFFVHQTHRRAPESNAIAVPIIRTFNPVTKVSAITFGPAQELERDADREQRRAFDQRLLEAMGGLVEVNVAHIVAVYIYLWCLHGRTGLIAHAELEAVARHVAESSSHPHIDPVIQTSLKEAINDTLRYFAAHGALENEASGVIPKRQAVLSAPALDRRYRRENPLKYVANQVLHLPGVISVIEEKVLESQN